MIVKLPDKRSVMPSKHLPFTLFGKASENPVVPFLLNFEIILCLCYAISVKFRCFFNYGHFSTTFPPRSNLCLRLPQNVFLVVKKIKFFEWNGHLAKADSTSSILCILNTHTITQCFHAFSIIWQNYRIAEITRNILVTSDIYLDFSVFPHRLHYIICHI